MNRNLKNFHNRLDKSGIKKRPKARLNDREPVRILIVCEGEKTEPNYFKKFNIDQTKALVDVVGIGFVSLSLVQEALKMQEAAQKKDISYHQIWCVFDRDQGTNTKENFNDAVQKDGKKGIRCVYSNECIELWYWLHFCYCDTAFTADNYVEKLDKKLKQKYEKNATGMYEELLSLQPVAIRNAKKLLDKHSERDGRLDPWNQNPSTTVFMLVEELNKYL